MKLASEDKFFRTTDVIIISNVRPVCWSTRDFEMFIYELKVLGSNGVEDFKIALNPKTDNHMIKRIKRGNRIARKFLLDKKFS